MKKSMLFKTAIIVISMTIIGFGVISLLQPKKFKKDPEYGKIFALYNVKDGSISLDKKWTEVDLKKNDQLWGRVNDVLPKSSNKFIKKFIVFSDGEFNIDASMSAINENNDSFQVYVDILDSFDRNNKIKGKSLTYNIIHEYGHVLTLNYTQLFKKKNESSKNLTIGEGTLKTTSYLNQFYNKYWKDYYKETQKILEIQDDDQKYIKQTEFYEKHKDQFVTQYASSEPIEDIAESFAYFIINEKPKNNSIKNEKILFFYNFEELVEIRDEVRNSIKNLLY